MSREEAIQELKKLQESGDTEMAHVYADEVLMNLLISLGYKDVADEYDKVGKWYA